MNLITLSELSSRYRITLDESWYHMRPEVRNPDRRWYERIPCRGGTFISLYAKTQSRYYGCIPRWSRASERFSTASKTTPESGQIFASTVKLRLFPTGTPSPGS